MQNTSSPADESNGVSLESEKAALAFSSTGPNNRTVQSIAAENAECRNCSINPLTVGRYLGYIITGLILGGAIANYAIYNIAPHPEHQIADVLKRFDLGHEPSIPAFYSAIVMLFAAATAAFLSVYDDDPANKRRTSWRILSVVLVLLAIDEVVMFHEMGTAAMEQLGLSGKLYFSWVIPGGNIRGSCCNLVHQVAHQPRLADSIAVSCFRCNLCVGRHWHGIIGRHYFRVS